MLPNNCQILLYNKTVDMRKSIDGLSIIISEHLHLNPSDGSIHIFYNKQYDKLKMLYWHKNGFNLLYKSSKVVGKNSLSTFSNLLYKN